jgi:peptide chain release factor subunit 3
MAQDEEQSTEDLFGMAFRQKQAKIKKGAPTMQAGFNKIPTRLIKNTAAPKPVVKKNKTDKVIDIDEMSEAVEFTEVDEVRQPASMIFIGHVDAGKSTICGNIMYLTGMVDDRTIKAY